jgi:uncharacterized hydrophobic protein (TIGR00271 family)
LAATIASYGLFANSPAVVIGAMIIAMLLGPITGISLALVDSDLKFLLKSLTTLFAGALVVITTGLVIGTIQDDLPLTEEILARTSPNLADLVIALAGGAAGAYATVSPRLSVAFVGVAIATALVPPLCAANILFTRGEISLGSGALLLTFTNIVAIQFASSVVFWLTGFRNISRTKGLSFFVFAKSNAVSIVILCVLVFVLTDSLHKILARKLFESSTSSRWARKSMRLRAVIWLRFDSKIRWMAKALCGQLCAAPSHLLQDRLRPWRPSCRAIPRVTPLNSESGLFKR